MRLALYSRRGVARPSGSLYPDVSAKVEIKGGDNLFLAAVKLFCLLPSSSLATETSVSLTWLVRLGHRLLFIV